jgi:HK97 family phage prohead protease
VELERKDFAVREFKAPADKPGVFEAVVSVFGNVDEIGDRMVFGSFARTLEERGPPPVYHSHQWQDGPIGYSTGAEELDAGDDRLPNDLKDFGGLFIAGQLFVEINDPYVNRIYAGMKTGGPREFSFAFRTKDSRTVTEDGEEVREILDVDLFEVGPTLVGMNRDTELIRVASALRGEDGPAAVVALEAALQKGLPGSSLHRVHEALIGAGFKCATEPQPNPDPGDMEVNLRKERIRQVLTMRRH